MPIFKNLFSSPRTPKAKAKAKDSTRGKGPETLPVKMNLEERMAFRRELLFEAVKVTLSNNFIAPNTYRFKVMHTDKRGHCYMVTFDMSPDFMTSEQGQHGQLTKLAAALTKNAQTLYGLVVGGVYWRVDETLAASVAEWARPSTPAPLAASQNSVDTHIENDECVTAEELAEFEAAWQKGSDIQIGDRTYSSDPAPLGDESRKS